MNGNHILAFALGFGFGAFIMMLFCTPTTYWQQELIKRGVAEYNQTNGNWQWKEQKK
jgi:hypothetical protein